MNKTYCVLTFLLAALAALGTLALARHSAAVYASEGKVDPLVIEDTAGRAGHFLVVLADQADASSSAAKAPNRIAQGQAVYDALRRTADATQPAIVAQLERLHASYRRYWIVNLIAVEGGRDVVDALAARSDVKAIEPDRAFRVPLETPEEAAAPATGVEWNVAKVNAPALWSFGFTGQNLVYANADTGVQWTHPALKPHYRGWNGSDATHDYNWWDAIHNPIAPGTNPCGYSITAPCDDYGHGTHTIGTGVGDDGAGNQVGVAPGAKWIACRNMDSGVGRPSTYIECLQFFLAPTDHAGNNPDPSKRPDAIGNSYACPPEELCTANSVLSAVDNMRTAGVFMAVSAGNSGSGCSTISDPPAIYDSSITVGATDQNDAIAGFSSRGPVTVDGSGRRKPDLSAPGVSVRSSYLGGGYASLSGTSMASPHVGSAVVLLWSALPQLRSDVGRTEDLLEQTAVHRTTTQGCGGDGSNQVPNNVYGFGRLDVLAAHNAVLASATTTATVIFQGREVPAPASPYNVPLSVRLYSPGVAAPVYSNTLHSDDYGRFELRGITGTYTITVKNSHTLTSQKNNVVLPAGASAFTMCALLEGDANNDDQIGILDFSVLASTFGKVAGDGGYDSRADFNNSGQVNINDFSALATNFGRQGPQLCP